MPDIPRDAYAAAAARIDDADLPVLALLLDGESLDAIAEALRIDRTEIAWRAQRIIGRLRPGSRADTAHANGRGLRPPLS
jgi:hypothetical protein